MNTMHLLLTAVVIVLFTALLACVFGLGSMLLDGWRFHSEAYKNYVETVRTEGLAIEQVNRDRDDMMKLLQAMKADLDAMKAKK